MTAKELLECLLFCLCLESEVICQGVCETRSQFIGIATQGTGGDAVFALTMNPV